jgi:hypothetical protein
MRRRRPVVLVKSSTTGYTPSGDFRLHSTLSCLSDMRKLNSPAHLTVGDLLLLSGLESATDTGSRLGANCCRVPSTRSGTNLRQIHPSVHFRSWSLPWKILRKLRLNGAKRSCPAFVGRGAKLHKPPKHCSMAVRVGPLTPSPSCSSYARTCW